MVFKKGCPKFYYFLCNLNQNHFSIAFSVNCRAKSDLLLQMEQIKPYKPKHKIRIVDISFFILTSVLFLETLSREFRVTESLKVTAHLILMFISYQYFSL